ncbi:S8 family serine peptidase [Lysobacter solisilvae]|uniref:S8 family serine peptidase n=1 Tax=Agrilutibacter solisilvae TaxID=2763317 RepID=A0A974Y4P8_9GAMM|nr:S8 family serine peptidase [Lysobacter solisilvae]QSX77986.1 S8 family serine peptidase [Lysobacter solisilvae]
MSTARATRNKRLAIATALAGLAGLAAWAAGSAGWLSSPSSTASSTVASAALAGGDVTGKYTAHSFDRSGATPHLVLFREAPLASYRGGMGIASPRKANGRLDARGQQARDYVHYLRNRQDRLEEKLERTLGHSLQVSSHMQHAVNGFVAVLSADEAARVSRDPEVALVEAYREYEADTDVGPRLIGAENVWNGVPATVGNGVNKAQGEGMVVAVFDSGINWGSPSFAATGADGYTVVNPLGSGQFIGTCAAGGPDEGRCNDKLIGGYDFVCDYRDSAGNILTRNCGVAGRREEPGFGDTHGHGSHTASTAAGSVRDATYRGAPVRISGVAPHANIIAFDICYTNISTGSCSAPNISVVASVNQVIADGLADVINYSFSGGASPWSESVSLALLNAVDAGVYVATSAGNSGPGPSTLGHNEPWTSSTAAAQHGRQGFDFFLTVDGPGTVPAPLQLVSLTPGSGGVDLSSAVPAGTPLVMFQGTAANTGFDGPSDGCAPYPAGTFTGAVAVIRRGTCGFAVKVANAAAAGATAVVLGNNQPGLLTPSVPGTTIPAFMITQASADALRDFHAVAGATGSITYPAVVTTNVADALGAFSSRGPAAFDVLKPDITAPGVNILAVIAGTTLTGFENAIGLMSGTSMASPHQAGAAALLRQINPSWTVPEVKSALMMTSAQTVLLEDQTTPANAFGAGAGRVQVDLATRAGLVMNETKANYAAANPNAGGDPSTLNQPSMAKARCIGTCTFVRTVRNTLPYKHQWRVTLEGLAGTVLPASLTLKPGESRQILGDDRQQHPPGRWQLALRQAGAAPEQLRQRQRGPADPADADRGVRACAQARTGQRRAGDRPVRRDRQPDALPPGSAGRRDVGDVPAGRRHGRCGHLRQARHRSQPSRLRLRLGQCRQQRDLHDQRAAGRDLVRQHRGVRGLLGHDADRFLPVSHA